MPSFYSSLRLLPLCSLILTPACALPSKNPVRAITYTPIGCYTDNVNGKRALDGLNAAENDMTVDKCAALCSNYELFGVEYGRECYCGHTADTGSTEVDPSECSFACAGNPDGVERCGAGNRLNLYRNPTPVARGPASLPGITSLGCFVDNGARVLPHRDISASDMTAAKCAANCAGFDYFGTQWSSECYCGSLAPTVPAPAAECNMKCSGNGNELCGAGMRLNVYKFDPASTTAPATGLTMPAVSGFDYKGCFTDNVPQRVLGGKSFAASEMTPDVCAASCRASGYGWFGVEFGSECYCGSKLGTDSAKVSEAECAMACNGNNSQKCGGANRISVYADPGLADASGSRQSSLGSFRYKSCWTDNAGGRVLKAVDYRADDMTLEKCAERCRGYSYFGVEFSRECFCGDDLGGRAALEKECGMLCAGASDQRCGGPDRLNLYTQVTESTSSSNAVISSSSTTSSLLSSSFSPSAVEFNSGTTTSTTSDSAVTSSSTTSSQLSSVISSSPVVSSTLSTSSATTSTPDPATADSSTSSSQHSSSFSSAVSSTSSSTIPTVSDLTTSSSSTTSSQLSSPLSSSVSVFATSTTISTTSNPAVSSMSTSSPQFSSFLPSSTSTTPTITTTSSPELATITDCPPAPTYNGVPDLCYMTHSLPQPCRSLSSMPNWRLLSLSLLACRSSLTRFDLVPGLQATSCFPTPFTSPTDQTSASSTATSIYQCLTAPAASLVCQFDAGCATKTYIAGQVPSSAPSIGADVLKDDGWESGTMGNWTLPGRVGSIELSVDGARPRSGNFGLSALYSNVNGATQPIVRLAKVVPGGTYEFKAYYWHTNQNASTSFTIGVYFNDVGASIVRDLKDIPVNQWQSRVQTFTAGSSIVQLRISFGGSRVGSVGSPEGTDNIYADDITLVRLS